MEKKPATLFSRENCLRIQGVTFRSHGSVLRGLLFRASGIGPRPTLLLLHGIPGTEQNVDIARALCQKGWNSLIFHYRGCWGSEGKYSISGILDDIEAATHFLKSQDFVDKGKLAIAGLSLGGWASLAYASEDPSFQCVVSMAPLSDPKKTPFSDDEAENFVRMLSGISAQKLQEEFKKIKPISFFLSKLAGRKILLILAGRDQYFPSVHYQNLFKIAPWLEVIVFPRADHIFFNCRRRLLRTVCSWLNNCF